MIFSNILLGFVILFFCVRLFFAIREGNKTKNKICLVSKKTGEVIELDAKAMSEFIDKEIQADFSNTAKMIFARVADGFAKGRIADIKNYLNEKVFPVFQQAILSRESLHQKAEFTLIGFKDVKILENSPNKKVVCFTTEQINLLKDEKDKVIEGDPLYVATVTENWTFTKKKEDSWVVSAIENKEAHFA